MKTGTPCWSPIGLGRSDLPKGRYEPHRYPYRTTWGRFDGEWIMLEKEVKWMELDNPNAYLPSAPAEILVTVFQGRTRKENVS